MIKNCYTQKQLSQEFTAFSIIQEQTFKPKQLLYHHPSQSYIRLMQVEPCLAYLDDDEQVQAVEPENVSDTISVFLTFR